MSQKKVIALAGIVALILGIATDRVLDNLSEEREAERVER